MRGVVFLGNRKLELREFPDPTPGPGDVVVAMKASGMCGSDLHPYRTVGNAAAALGLGTGAGPVIAGHRSEEHTSELQSRLHLVCRLLLEKKKKKTRTQQIPKI